MYIFQIYAWFSLLVVALSITVYCLETYPPLNSPGQKNKEEAIPRPDQAWQRRQQKHLNDLEVLSTLSPYAILLITDHVCNAFFFLEFCLKFISCPNKTTFMRAPITIIELLCIVPFYVAIVLVAFHHNPSSITGWLTFLYFWRLLRIFRCFTLMKHFRALKILVYTIRASVKELLLLAVILILGVVVFACLAFQADSYFYDGDDLLIPHIPMGFWWAIVTMTTVGYGDKYPKSWAGHLVGALCATSGVLLIALTVPIIVNNFAVYYTHAQSTSKLKERRMLKGKVTKKRSADTVSTSHENSINQVAPLGVSNPALPTGKATMDANTLKLESAKCPDRDIDPWTVQNIDDQQ